MKGEDYDAFIEDPADWAIRKYWPRVFTELEGLALLPPLGIGAFGAYACRTRAFSKSRPWQQPSLALARAADAQAAADARAIGSSQRLAALGFLPSPSRAADRGAFRSHVGHAPRYAGHHARPVPETGEAPCRAGKGPPLRARICHRLSPGHGSQCRFHPPPPRLRRLHVAASVREVLLAPAQGPHGRPRRGRHHALRLLRGDLGPALEVPRRAAQGKDRWAGSSRAMYSRSRKSSATRCALSAACAIPCSRQALPKRCASSRSSCAGRWARGAASS